MWHDESGEEHEEHGFPPGFTTLILEMTGMSALSGEEAEGTFFELLPGVSYTPIERIELRFGVRFPLYKPSRLDTQYLFTIGPVF